MNWPVIISVYIAAYALVMALGYHRMLPYYSRKEQLRSGANFDTQCSWRRAEGRMIMRLGSIVWAVTTFAFGLIGLILPFDEEIHRPKLVSIMQVKNQSKTIVLADGKLFTLEYQEGASLRAKHPGMFLVCKKNLFGMAISEPKLKINNYVEEFDELVDIVSDGVRKTADKKAEENGP